MRDAMNQRIGLLLLILTAPFILAAENHPDPLSQQVVFFALGDQGTGKRHQRQVAHAMELVAAQTQGVDFVLLLGDNFYPQGVVSTEDPQWQTKFETIYSGPILSHTPFYPIIGNHDARSSLEAQVTYGQQKKGSGRWRMQARNYFQDFGHQGSGQPLMRLVMLDTTQNVKQSAAFVQHALQSDSSHPVWRLVAGHYPLRSSGSHGDSTTLLTGLLPALRSAGVDLYLSGHDHDLEIIQAPDEPMQVVSGGGGQDLYALEHQSPWSTFVAQRHGFVRVEATTKQLKLTVFDDQGTELHQTQLAAATSEPL